jgi:hypothetical protein
MEFDYGHLFDSSFRSKWIIQNYALALSNLLNNTIILWDFWNLCNSLLQEKAKEKIGFLEIIVGSFDVFKLNFD